MYMYKTHWSCMICCVCVCVCVCVWVSLCECVQRVFCTVYVCVCMSARVYVSVSCIAVWEGTGRGVCVRLQACRHLFACWFDFTSQAGLLSCTYPLQLLLMVPKRRRRWDYTSRSCDTLTVHSLHSHSLSLTSPHSALTLIDFSENH